MLACLVFGREARQFLTLLALRTVHEDRVEHRNDEQREDRRERQTADHGNAEKMVDEKTGQPYTAHTVGDVQAVLVNGPKDVAALNNGKLADISPTLLDLLGIKQPAEMTGKSLLVRK